MSVVNKIVCDHCGIIGMESKGKDRLRIHSLRYLLSGTGWLTSVRGGLDYCPICRKVMKGKPATISPKQWTLLMRIKREYENSDG